MDFSSFLFATIQAGTPLLFATLGEILTERSGNLNLGVEGMMLMGAVAGISVGFATGNPVLALIGSIVVAAAGALIFAFLTVTLRANQVVTGLTLTIFGSGVSAFMGKKIAGQMLPADIKAAFAEFKLPLLGDIPVVGKIFFQQDILVYLAYLATLIVGLYIYRTSKGLNLRAIGENPSAADASGINVSLYKYLNILAGGALCGLGGAYLSLAYSGTWQENITAGRGWIAVALVIFCVWSPYRAILGAYFFGGLNILGLYLQGFKINIPLNIIDMIPYAATIVVLVAMSIKKSKERQPPHSLGNAYFREDR